MITVLERGPCQEQIKKLRAYNIEKRELRNPDNCFQIVKRSLCGEMMGLSGLSRWQDRTDKWTLEFELELGDAHLTIKACPTQKELSPKLQGFPGRRWTTTREQRVVLPWLGGALQSSHSCGSLWFLLVHLFLFFSLIQSSLLSACWARPWICNSHAGLY